MISTDPIALLPSTAVWISLPSIYGSCIKILYLFKSFLIFLIFDIEHSLKILTPKLEPSLLGFNINFDFEILFLLSEIFFIILKFGVILLFFLNILIVSKKSLAPLHQNRMQNILREF